MYATTPALAAHQRLLSALPVRVHLRSEHPRPAALRARPEPEQYVARVLAVIESHPGIRMRALRDSLPDIPAPSLSGSVSDLVQQGRVRHEGQRNAYSYFATGQQKREPMPPVKSAFREA